MPASIYHKSGERVTRRFDPPDADRRVMADDVVAQAPRCSEIRRWTFAKPQLSPEIRVTDKQFGIFRDLTEKSEMLFGDDVYQSVSVHA